MTQRIEVLDKGFVELIDSLGSDLTVVNSARVVPDENRAGLERRDGQLHQLELLGSAKLTQPYCFHRLSPALV